MRVNCELKLYKYNLQQSTPLDKRIANANVAINDIALWLNS